MACSGDLLTRNVVKFSLKFDCLTVLFDCNTEFIS
jgi:hypothetical protein